MVLFLFFYFASGGQGTFLEKGSLDPPKTFYQGEKCS